MLMPSLTAGLNINALADAFPNSDVRIPMPLYMNTNALLPMPSLMPMPMAGVNTNADAFPTSRSEY